MLRSCLILYLAVLLIFLPRSTAAQQLATPDTTQSATKYATLSGRVVDSEGKPLVGATVIIEGTNRGAKTKADGKFTISKLVTQQEYKIKASFTGFHPFTTTILLVTDTKIGTITLHMSNAAIGCPLGPGGSEPTKEMIDHTQVGTIRTIKAEEIVRIPR